MNEILEQHSELLESLATKKVFTIDESHGKWSIIEACDEYYGVTVTASMAEELSQVFAKIADAIKNT